MQTFNVSNNQQVQFYNYSSDVDDRRQQPATPASPVQSRDSSNNPLPGAGAGAQSNPGEPRILEKWPPLGWQAEHAALDGKIDALSGNVNAVKANLIGLRSDVNGVKGDVLALAKSESDLSAKVDNVQSGVTGIQGKFAALDRGIGQINKNVDGLKAQDARNAKDLTDIKATLGNLAPDVKGTASQTSGLQEFEQWVKENCKPGGSGH